MLEFKRATLEDKEWVKNCFEKVNADDCEYCFGTIFLWGPVYKIKICRYKDFFISKMNADDENYYCFPKGEGNIKEAIDEIIKDAEAHGVKAKLFGLDSDDRRNLEKLFPGEFDIIEDRDNFDYIYLSDELAQLKGKKYHSKRNHIIFFENNFNWKYEKIDESNISDCLSMTEKWEKDNDGFSDEGLEHELLAIKKGFEYYKELDFCGGLLRADGEVVAYTFGERMTDDTFCTHFEKAFSSVRGAYPMINREFAKNELAGKYKYVNREEDMGLEGLRKAKLSYHPEILSEIYYAEKR